MHNHSDTRTAAGGWYDAEAERSLLGAVLVEPPQRIVAQCQVSLSLYIYIYNILYI